MKNPQKEMADRFLELLRPIERELEAYCRRMIWEPQDVADAVQSAVLRAFQAFDRYHDGTNFRAWMFKILTNEIFTLNRKRGHIRKFEVFLEPEEMDAVVALEWDIEYTQWLLSPHAWADTLDENLVIALKTLTESERAVLVLRAIGELQYREISETLNIPLGSVMGHLSRARQKMRNAIMRSQKGATL